MEKAEQTVDCLWQSGKSCASLWEARVSISSGGDVLQGMEMRPQASRPFTLVNFGG
jgi:hypothetical protein